MFKILRMICAVAAAALVTACLFAGIYAETLVPAFGCAAAAALLFVLCLLFKYLQEEKENKENAGKTPDIPFSSASDADAGSAPGADAADEDADGDLDTDADEGGAGAGESERAAGHDRPPRTSESGRADEGDRPRVNENGRANEANKNER